MALYEAASSIIWARMLLEELGCSQLEPTVLKGDNQGANKLTHELNRNTRMRHIKAKYHFTRERQDMGELQVAYVRSADNVADIFTKAVSRPIFEYLCSKLGLYSSFVDT